MVLSLFECALFLSFRPKNTISENFSTRGEEPMKPALWCYNNMYLLCNEGVFRWAEWVTVACPLLHFQPHKLAPWNGRSAPNERGLGRGSGCPKYGSYSKIPSVRIHFLDKIWPFLGHESPLSNKCPFSPPP